MELEFECGAKGFEYQFQYLGSIPIPIIIIIPKVN
jgi:hypothetical protein